jgi:ribosomal protein S1
MLDNENGNEWYEQIEAFDVPKRGEILKAQIVKVTNDGLYIHIGSKSEGFIPANQLLLPVDEYEENQEIEATLLKRAEDNPLFSEKRVFFDKAKKAFVEAVKNGKVIYSASFVEEKERGYIMHVHFSLDGRTANLSAFLPKSHLWLKEKNIDSLRERKITVMVLSVKEKPRLNIVVSHKEYIQKKRAEAEESRKNRLNKFFEKISTGDIVEGKVRSITDFGVFVKIGPIDGLVHRSEVTWTTDNPNLESIFEKGQKVKCKIIKIDPESHKVSLSIKQLEENPWDSVKEDSVISVSVKKIVDYKGVVVKLQNGIEGFLPMSEIFWGKRKDPRTIMNENDVLEVKVLTVDKDRRRVVVSLKNLKGNPWENIDEKYKEGDIVESTITGVRSFGIFVELEDGVESRVRTKELSWDLVNPLESFKEGDKVKVKILKIDKNNARMDLSVKRTTNDPFEAFYNSHKIGEDIEVKVVEIQERGLLVETDDGIKGFLPNRFVEGEHKVGDLLKCKIMDLKYFPNKDIRIFKLSEKAYADEKQKQQEKEDLEKYSDEIKTPTLGDIWRKNK